MKKILSCFIFVIFSVDAAQESRIITFTNRLSRQVQVDFYHSSSSGISKKNRVADLLVAPGTDQRPVVSSINLTSTRVNCFTAAEVDEQGTENPVKLFQGLSSNSYRIGERRNRDMFVIGTEVRQPVPVDEVRYNLSRCAAWQVKKEELNKLANIAATATKPQPCPYSLLHQPASAIASGMPHVVSPPRHPSPLAIAFFAAHRAQAREDASAALAAQTSVPSKTSPMPQIATVSPRLSSSPDASSRFPTAPPNTPVTGRKIAAEQLRPLSR